VEGGDRLFFLLKTCVLDECCDSCWLCPAAACDGGYTRTYFALLSSFPRLSVCLSGCVSGWLATHTYIQPSQTTHIHTRNLTQSGHQHASAPHTRPPITPPPSPKPRLPRRPDLLIPVPDPLAQPRRPLHHAAHPRRRLPRQHTTLALLAHKSEQHCRGRACRQLDLAVCGPRQVRGPEACVVG
jgi:hypothetical protein